MYVIDNATKKAVIDNIAQKRVLMNETIVFSGQIRNTGSFAIGTCKLEIKLINNPLNAGNLSSSNLFNPMNLFKSNNDDPAQKSSTVKQDFVVAKNIKSGEIRNFSVSMRYPSHFSQSSTIQKLNCY